MDKSKKMLSDNIKKDNNDEKENIETKKTANFKKNVIWNILGTGFNSFNSLFFLIIVTRINGTTNAGIFTIAFSTACILYIIGTYAGRIYQVTENDKEITDKDYIANRIISFFIQIVCAILFVIIRRYDIYKSSIFIILAVYKGLEAFSDVLYGIMQKKDMLYKVGISYFLKSLFSLSVFLLIDLLTKNMVLSCASIVIIWIIFIALYDLRIVNKLIDKNEKVSKNSIKKIYKNGFFVFAITFLGIYTLNAPKYAIDSYLTEDYQTIFGIIVMPATAISLFGQFLIHPYLTEFASDVKNKEYIKLQKLTRKIVTYICLFGVFATILAYFVGIPVLQLVYGVELSNYRIMLTIIIISATFYNIGTIYSYALTSMRKTFIQFIDYLPITILAFVISNVLTKKYEIVGSVLAYFIIMFAIFIAFIITEKKILNDFCQKEKNEEIK